MSSARAIIETETPKTVFRAALLRKGSRVLAQHPIGGGMEPGRVEELYPNGIMMVRWDDDPQYLGTCVPGQVRVIPEAETPKNVFRQATRPFWIGGGLWMPTHNFSVPSGSRRGQLGHVFFYVKRPESFGGEYRTAAQGDDKWHMRDVLGEPNSVACAQAFDTEEEAKAALVAWLVRKGYPEPQVTEAENPKSFLKRMSRLSWKCCSIGHNTLWFKCVEHPKYFFKQTHIEGGDFKVDFYMIKPDNANETLFIGHGGHILLPKSDHNEAAARSKARATTWFSEYFRLLGEAEDPKSVFRQLPRVINFRLTFDFGAGEDGYSIEVPVPTAVLAKYNLRSYQDVLDRMEETEDFQDEVVEYARAKRPDVDRDDWMWLIGIEPQEPTVSEAEDPKQFLRTLGTGESIRTKGDLRRYIAVQIRQMPEKDSDDGPGYPGNTDFLLAWYKQLDTEVMPRIMKALERFYGVQAPNGTSGLFRTWIKNKQTERRAAQIIAGFEEIIKGE